MKICIDGRDLVFDSHRGETSLYTYRLVESLPRFAPTHAYTLYFNFFRGRLSNRVPALRDMKVRTRVLKLPRRRADLILTASDYVKGEIVEHLEIPEALPAPRRTSFPTRSAGGIS